MKYTLRVFELKQLLLIAVWNYVVFTYIHMAFIVTYFSLGKLILMKRVYWKYMICNTCNLKNLFVNIVETVIIK